MKERSWVVPVVAGVIGATVMTASLGWSVVNPTRYEWLMHGDYGLHFLGWHLYRRGPWTLPVGATPLHVWPIGSSIGLTDSIPIVGIPLKLFDAVLPEVFQYIGLWLVLSVAMQAVFGVLLMRVVTTRVSLQMLGAMLIMLSPPLFYRINHAALTAHWLVLAALWLSLRPDADVASWRLGAWWAAVCGVTAATQPYMLLMVAVLMVAAHARQGLVAPRQIVRAGLNGAMALAASGLALWQSGSLMIRSNEGLEVGGFGVWSTNLLSFIMPTEANTLFFPGLFPYEHREQYEGYAYLGLGMLLLALVALVAAVRAMSRAGWWRGRVRYLPFALALAFLTAMALGPQITAGTHTLLTYDRSWWAPLRVFRTSGRMVWPIYYATVIGVLFVIARRFSNRTALALLTIGLATQAIDLAGMTRYLGDVRAFGFRDPLVNPFWSTVAPRYDGFLLIPSNLCSVDGYIDFNPFLLHAGIERIGVNAGMTARYDVRKARAHCDELRHEVRTGLKSNRALYIVRPDLVAEIQASSKDRVICTVIDGHVVCYTRDSLARWPVDFDLPRSRLPDAAEFARFYAALDDTYKSSLGRNRYDAPGPTSARVEALVGYVAYRREGCTHVEAEARMLERLDTGRGAAPCAAATLHPTMPPADETLAFARRMADVLGTRRGTVMEPTHVDPEGEAVWLQAYVVERARGVREIDARATVLHAIRGAAR
jgi:hypothetical protein